jgi:predicted SAM-dependent methyltransferase
MISIRSRVKSALNVIGLLEPARGFRAKVAKQKTRRAFETSGLKKLHLGCDKHLLPGWFNTDLNPKCPSVAALDATKSFPFPSDSCEEIFTEHMIEHISYPNTINMLKECYRVLQPGGKIRISTPNLAFLVALYEPKSELQWRYIKWSSETCISWAPKPSSAFVINNYFRDWGQESNAGWLSAARDIDLRGHKAKVAMTVDAKNAVQRSRHFLPILISNYEARQYHRDLTLLLRLIRAVNCSTYVRCS